MINWLSTLLRAIELETVDAELLEYIDDILDWKVIREQSDLYLKLSQEHGEHFIDVRFEELLDRLIVGDFALGEMFPTDLTDEQAKRRYRKLIRIFHPDKGFKSQLWLNYRAERINKAYQAFIEKSVEVVENNPEPVSEVFNQNYGKSKSQSNPTKKKLNTRFKYRPNVWRERLGDPKQFQKKMLTILLVVSFSMIGIVYWTNKGETVSTQIESLDEIDGKVLVDNDNKKTADYINDIKAKKILQEADKFLLNQESEGLIGYDLDLELISDSGLSSTAVEFDNVISSKINNSIDVLNDKCHGYLDLSSSVIVDEKESIQKLLSRYNLYSGPSKDCDLIAVLEPETEILLFSKSQDELWLKVISNQNKDLIGWIDVDEISSKMNDSDHDVVDEQEVQPQLGLANVSSFKGQNIERSNGVDKWEQEIEVFPQKNLEQRGQADHPKDQSSVVSVKSNNYKSAIYLMLLEDLKNYYQIGDSKKISSLYIRSGRENKIRGAEQIRKYYKQAFKKTTDRKFDYSIESYKEEDDSTAMMQGSLNLSLKIIKTGVVEKINATFTIWVFKHGKGYKIVSFEWARK